ncbi:MAG: sigma-70 family RNA polymerase sigma factor [Candidatus Eremiobacterota bacterium]
MAEDERSLVAAAKNGDRTAFEALAERYAPRIFALIYRMVRGQREEAEDLTQEVLLRAYQALASFREDASFYTWLYRIAVNRTLNRIQKKKLSSVSLDEPLQEGDRPREVADPDSCFQPAAALENRELGQTLQKAVDQLSESLRVVFLMREVEGLSHEEIAAALGSTSQAVRVRLHRAKKELMERLAPYVSGAEGRPA